MPTTTWRSERARLAGAVSNGNAVLAESARATLKALRAEDYIKRLVEEAPPLSAEQRDRLAVLLRPNGGAAA